MIWDIRPTTWERRSRSAAPTVSASRRRQWRRSNRGWPQPGQAIYQYAGDYPQLSSYLTNTNFVYAQTDYRVNEKLTALFGFRYTNETGFTYNPFTVDSNRPTATTSAT